jgi:hypothetical protein
MKNMKLIMENFNNFLSEKEEEFSGQKVLSKQQQKYIAAAIHVPEHEEYWPDDSMKGGDIEHPQMYQWSEQMGEFEGDPDDEWGHAEHGNTADSWHVEELREPPNKFPEAELGWYVIHSPFHGNRKAIAGPFKNWEAAAKEADNYGEREHLYR